MVAPADYGCLHCAAAPTRLEGRAGTTAAPSFRPSELHASESRNP